MTSNKKDGAIVDAIARELPYLRRYGRALSGNQGQGDEFATATLETITRSSGALTGASSIKVGLFSVFQEIWNASKGEVLVDETGLAAKAQEHLSKLKSGSRDALLLSSLEQFGLSDVATIMQMTPDKVRHLLNEAYSDMANSMSGRILIIEDDAAIADDLETIATDMGHEVTGNADTHASAVAMAMEDEPDLILADVVLADDTSGEEAAQDILTAYDEKPVIFVTGHPERLLTGERPEPAFLIPKPYMHDQVRTAISQALFFSGAPIFTGSDDA